MILNQKDACGIKLDDPLASIMAMSTDELSRTWRNIIGRPVPTNVPKSLISRMLAYRLQSNQHGDLAKETTRLLDAIASHLTAGKIPDIKSPSERRMKPGTVLVREHKGVQHKVMVMTEGFVWQGKTFTSLSSAAKAITGTNWNGQRFFGLKEKARSGAEI